VPADAQQAPAVVTGHAVGLRTGDGRHVVTAVAAAVRKSV
jgi:hypothetical protein